MNVEDKIIVQNRYSKRFHEYGYDPRTLGWGKGGRQSIRFSVLTSIDGFTAQSSVLDVGCGFADLYGYLNQKGWHGFYTGYDIVPELLTEAVKVYPSVNVLHKDILDEPNDQLQFDFVIASGIFNFKIYHDDNLLFIEKMIDKMFMMCKQAVAIDFFSEFVDFKNDGAYHTSIIDIISIIRKRTKRFSIRHDYMPYEFCAYIYKNDIIANNNVFKYWNELVGR